MSLSKLSFESSRKRENIDDNIKSIASENEQERKGEVSPEVDGELRPVDTLRESLRQEVSSIDKHAPARDDIVRTRKKDSKIVDRWSPVKKFIQIEFIEMNRPSSIVENVGKVEIFHPLSFIHSKSGSESSTSKNKIEHSESDSDKSDLERRPDETSDRDSVLFRESVNSPEKRGEDDPAFKEERVRSETSRPVDERSR